MSDGHSAGDSDEESSDSCQPKAAGEDDKESWVGEALVELVCELLFGD